MDRDAVMTAFAALLTALRQAKPGDRSEKDRWFQIVITEVQKTRLVYHSGIALELGTEGDDGRAA